MTNYFENAFTLWNYFEALFETTFKLLWKCIENELSWKRCFANTSINNKTINNILSNYIPHETIDRDRDPPWINKDIKQLILD